MLELREQDEADQSVIVAAVRNWLEQNANWLVIYDNADEPPVSFSRSRVFAYRHCRSVGRMAVSWPWFKVHRYVIEEMDSKP